MRISKKITRPPKGVGGGEGGGSACIVPTNVLYSIQGPCFMDNESSA